MFFLKQPLATDVEAIVLYGLLGLMLYVPVNTFQSNRYIFMGKTSIKH